MIGTRHEEYANDEILPFRLNTDIERTVFNLSREDNWHEDIEIQLCTDGAGSVLVGGAEYPFEKGNTALISSNVIHYTHTRNKINYVCIIISGEFCKRVGIDYDTLSFSPVIKDEKAELLIKKLCDIYENDTSICKIPKLNSALLNILIYAVENYSDEENKNDCNKKSVKRVKSAIKYIRENYSEKITLDMLSKYLLTDKYALCREFKKATGQTINQYINSYRCTKALSAIREGASVSEAALMCGFNNLSFFSRTFKKYVGKLPSECGAFNENLYITDHH